MHNALGKSLLCMRMILNDTDIQKTREIGKAAWRIGYKTI